MCFSTSRRLERSERTYGVSGSSSRASSASLRAPFSSSKIKEKKKKNEEEDKGKESPKTGEKLEDEEVSEVIEVKDEEGLAEKKLLTNGDTGGEELKKAEMMEDEVKGEVRNPQSSSAWYRTTQLTCPVLRTTLIDDRWVRVAPRWGSWFDQMVTHMSLFHGVAELGPQVPDAEKVIADGPKGVAEAAALDSGDGPAADVEEQKNKEENKDSAEAEDVLGDVVI